MNELDFLLTTTPGESYLEEGDRALTTLDTVRVEQVSEHERRVTVNRTHTSHSTRQKAIVSTFTEEVEMSVEARENGMGSIAHMVRFDGKALVTEPVSRYSAKKLHETHEQALKVRPRV